MWDFVLIVIDVLCGVGFICMDFEIWSFVVWDLVGWV